jgi:DNA-binding transcriptional MerR regulator
MLIGEFSAATQLSVKMLRHYHDIGLLVPAEIDPRTGYRHYAAEQLGQASVVGLLRRADMPLADIQALLDSDAETGADVLDRHRLRLAQERSAVDRRLALVERLIKERWSMPLDITVQNLPALRVAYKRVEGPQTFVGPLLTAALAELGTAIEALGVDLSQATRPVMVVHHGDEERFVQDACLPLPSDVAVPGLDVQDLPSIEAATAIYEGDMEGLNAAIHTVMGWIKGRGWEFIMPFRIELRAVAPFFGNIEGKPGSTLAQLQIPYRR